MHQILFRLGLRPKRRWGAYSAPQTPQLDLTGPTTKGRKGWEGKGREGMGGTGGERREGEEAVM